MRNNIYGGGGDGVSMGETYRRSQFHMFLEKVTMLELVSF